MEGVKDRLGDLSWVGIMDRAWIEVDVPDPVVTFDHKAFIDEQIAHMLKESASFVAADNTNMTKEQRFAWIEYRRLLNEIHLQADYPQNIFWPPKPE